jgi:hypothetical protein
MKGTHRTAQKASFVICIFFLFAFFPLLVQAGAIRGYVNDADGGAGLQDIWVDAYDMNGNWVAEAQTDNDGNYELAALPAGDYKVHFDAFHTRFLSEWYTDAPDFSQADPVTVTDTMPVDNVDASLATGGSISGVVTSDGTTPVPGVWVDVYDDATGDWMGYSEFETDADGAFTVYGLPSGTEKYTVYFDAFGTRYLGEWYKDAAEYVDAVKVSVQGTGDTVLDNAVLALGAEVAGVIKDSNDQPLAGVEVLAFDSKSSATGYIFSQTASVTGSDGQYSLVGLPLDTDYYVFFWATATDYVSQWYSGNPLSGTVKGIDATLQPGGSISGRVTDGRDGMADVYINVYDSTNSDFLTGSAITDADGYYTVTGLASASHRLEFFYWGGSIYTNYNEWYNDKSDFATADDVLVTGQDETTGINVVLGPGKAPVLTPVYLLLLNN